MKMQAVPATGYAIAEQALDCLAMAGAAAGVQAAEPDAAAGKPSFTKLLLQGLAAETASGSPEPPAEKPGEGAASDEEAPSQDVSLMGGLAMCCFVPATIATQAEDAETQAAEAPVPGDCGQDMPPPDLPVEAQVQDLQETGSLPENASGNADALQRTDSRPAEAFAQKMPAQPPEPPKPDEGPEMQEEDHGQHAAGNVVQDSPKDAAGGVAEKVTNLLRSMSDEASKEESFGRLLSKEKEPAYQEAAESQAVPGAQTQFQQVSERSDAAVTEKRAAVERALNSFLEDLRSAQSGGREIRIVLEPESLGELRISVTSSEKGIVARIKSRDREICAIIGDQIQKLVQSMESKGIAVENVDVLFEQVSWDSGSGGKSHASGDERRPNRGYKDEKSIDSVDGQSVYAWKGILEAAAVGDGALEYRV